MEAEIRDCFLKVLDLGKGIGETQAAVEFIWSIMEFRGLSLDRDFVIKVLERIQDLDHWCGFILCRFLIVNGEDVPQPILKGLLERVLSDKDTTRIYNFRDDITSCVDNYLCDNEEGKGDLLAGVSDPCGVLSSYFSNEEGDEEDRDTIHEKMLFRYLQSFFLATHPYFISWNREIGLMGCVFRNFNNVLMNCISLSEEDIDEYIRRGLLSPDCRSLILKAEAEIEAYTDRYKGDQFDRNLGESHEALRSARRKFYAVLGKTIFALGKFD